MKIDGPLGLLVTLNRRLKRSEGNLVLVNVGDELVQLLRLTRLDTLLDVRARATAGLSAV